MHIQFNKREAQLLKGLAILMMVFHHLLGFPEWIAPENMYLSLNALDAQLVHTLASFCKICVGLYIFMTGYGLAKGVVTLRSNARRVARLLFRYWSVFAAFIVIGVLFDEPLPSLRLLLLQAFGLCTATGYGWDYHTTIHPIFAWYVSVYILFMLTLPLLQRLCRRGFLADMVGAHCTLYALGLSVWACSKAAVPMPKAFVSLMRLYSIYAPVGMTGFLISKHGVFEPGSLPPQATGASRPQALSLRASCSARASH